MLSLAEGVFHLLMMSYIAYGSLAVAFPDSFTPQPQAREEKTH